MKFTSQEFHSGTRRFLTLTNLFFTMAELFPQSCKLFMLNHSPICLIISFSLIKVIHKFITWTEYQYCMWSYKNIKLFPLPYNRGKFKSRLKSTIFNKKTQIIGTRITNKEKCTNTNTLTEQKLTVNKSIILTRILYSRSTLT